MMMLMKTKWGRWWCHDDDEEEMSTMMMSWRWGGDEVDNDVMMMMMRRRRRSPALCFLRSTSADTWRPLSRSGLTSGGRRGVRVNFRWFDEGWGQVGGVRGKQWYDVMSSGSDYQFRLNSSLANISYTSRSCLQGNKVALLLVYLEFISKSFKL